jgi:predicted MFS family arabinose efflux permease
MMKCGCASGQGCGYTAGMDSPPAARPRGPSRTLTFACAASCGALIANLYYAQPLVSLMAPELGLSPRLAGLIVTITQLGYGAGLLLLVPLADRFDNRRLILVGMSLTTLALLGVALARQPTGVFIAVAVAGLCSSGAQVIVPMVAALAPEARRGRAIGNVMAGLLGGIMLARPVAGLIAAWLGWRAVFAFAALLIALMLGWLARILPSHRPLAPQPYRVIIRSMLQLLPRLPALRRRGLYQALLFGAFNVFWTATPLLLARQFGFTQTEIALFALAGASGALAAPLAGRLADRGLLRLGTLGALVGVTLSFLVAAIAPALHSVAVLVACALLLDAAVQSNHILSQRLIYALLPEARGRINAIYITMMFAGGALGSSVATLAFEGGGWLTAAFCGAALGAVALGAFLTEPAATAPR